MAMISDLTRILGTLASKLLFSQLVVFWYACTVVKEQILLVFPSMQPPEETPPCLPPHVRKYLKLTTVMSDDDLVQVWQVMGEMVWSLDHHFRALDRSHTHTEHRSILMGTVPYRTYFWCMRYSMVYGTG